MMMNSICKLAVWACALAVFGVGGFVSPAAAAIKTWNGTTNDWAAGANWTNGLPVDGDTVLIYAGSVLLTNATPDFESFTINGGALTFTNWTAKLTATNVAVNGGTITLPSAFTNNAMSNRVHIVCSNLTVAAGGSINADGKGYAGNIGSNTGNGPGGGGQGVSGAGHGGGGGYGGRGGAAGVSTGCGTYGNPEEPTDPGSGGGKFPGLGVAGEAGGGAIRIEATGDALVDGTMSANGGTVTAAYGGGGSGGGIYILCRTFSGSGTISANGGSNTSGYGGGGAGGRISISYNLAAQSTTNDPTGVISAARGIGGWQDGDVGTLYFPDARFLNGTVRHTGQWLSPDGTNWTAATLLLTNSWLRFPRPGNQLTVTGNVTLAGTASLEVGGNSYAFGVAQGTYYKYTLYDTNTVASVFSIGGNLSLGTGCTVRLYTGHTNAAAPDYGILLSVTGDVVIASNAWVYSSSQITNGGSPLLRMSNLTVTAGGGINADAGGYYGRANSSGLGYGAGGGSWGISGVWGAGGGGYGGIGAGGASANGGATNGPTAAPVSPGSSGGAWSSTYLEPGRGGGAIRIESTGAITADGTLTANGAMGGAYCGGGAGGGIYLTCKSFSGSGLLRANGGGSASGGSGGGGGGGRVAVIYDLTAQSATNNPTGVFSAAGGIPSGWGKTGDVGTLYFPDARFLTNVVRHSGQWLSPGLTGWAPGSLLLTNSRMRFPQEGFQLTVTSDVTLAQNSMLDIGPSSSRTGTTFLLYNTGAVASVFSIGGNLTLGTGCTVRLYAARTNSATPDYGVLMSVVGDVAIASNAWIQAISQITNGGSPLLRMNNLTVAAGGGINADGYGFTAVNGPGAGGSAGGGGYGGAGGGANGGGTYGSSNAPVAPGSSSGLVAYGPAGNPGGLIRIEALGAATINGTLTANGTGGVYGGNNPGGSGGGIYLSCGPFSGAANAILRANGGTGYGTGGGGGGGRIAVWRYSSKDTYQGSYSVAGGSAGNPGAAGTVVVGDRYWAGTIFIVR